MLKDPPLLKMRRSWQRLEPNLLERLTGVQTGHLVDAMVGRGALDAEIKPIDPTNAHFVGSALTCEPFADDNLAILAAVARAEPGDVLIVAADAFRGTAVVGDNVCLMAKNAGVRAIVVDGMVRDLDGIVAAGVPVHARGVTPNSCVRNGPGRVGFPAVVGGRHVAPGDLVVGDRDGVVTVPAGDAARIADLLDEIRRAEAGVQAKIRTGIKTLDAVAELLASEKVEWFD